MHLRFDGNRYITRPKRELCCLIPVDNFVYSEQVNNQMLGLTLAEKILTYLPISEELCIQEDTALSRYHQK